MSLNPRKLTPLPPQFGCHPSDSKALLTCWRVKLETCSCVKTWDCQRQVRTKKSRSLYTQCRCPMECHGIPSHQEPEIFSNTSQAAHKSFVFAQDRFDHGVWRSAGGRDRAPLAGVSSEDVGRDGGQDVIWQQFSRSISGGKMFTLW